MTTHDARFNSQADRNLRLMLDRDLWLCKMKGPHCGRVATKVEHIVDRADGGDLWKPGQPTGFLPGLQ
jgi:hypothetical protein